MSYTLQITVVNGRNLPSADLNGYSDPYCKIFWGGKQARTSVKKRTLNPHWNETFTLTGSNANEDVKISCFDKDRFTKDDVLGGGTASTQGLINGIEKSCTIHLTPRGEIIVRLKAINFPQSSQTTTNASTGMVYGGGAGEMTVDEMVRQRFRPPTTTTTTTTYYGSGGFPMSGGVPMSGGAPMGASMNGGYPMTGGLAPPPGYTGGMAPPSGYGGMPMTTPMYNVPPTGGVPMSGGMPMGAPGYPMGGAPPPGGMPPMTGGYVAGPPMSGGYVAGPPMTAPVYNMPMSGGYPMGGAPPGGMPPATGGYPGAPYGAAPTQPPMSGYMTTPGTGYPPRY